MKIQIELIIIFTIGLLFLFWAIWYRWTARRLKRKYDKNPNNDKSKKGGGEERGSSEVGRTEPNIPEAISSPPGPTEPSERTSVPTANLDVSGTNVSRPRNALDRIRRTRRRK